MFSKSYQSDEARVELLCVTGDRIEVSSVELMRFLLSGTFIAFLIAYCLMLVVIGEKIYGIETSIPFRALYWPLNSAAIGVVYAVTFGLADSRARWNRHNYVIHSLALHTFAIILTTPISAFFVGILHGVEAPLAALKMWDFTRVILIALVFEIVVVNWLWPWENRAAAPDIAPSDSEISAFREALQKDLAKSRLARMPYFSFRSVHKKGPGNAARPV